MLERTPIVRDFVRPVVGWLYGETGPIKRVCLRGAFCDQVNKCYTLLSSRSVTKSTNAILCSPPSCRRDVLSFLPPSAPSVQRQLANWRISACEAHLLHWWVLGFATD
jgi:hypothetical protein